MSTRNCCVDTLMRDPLATVVRRRSFKQARQIAGPAGAELDTLLLMKPDYCGQSALHNETDHSGVGAKWC